MKVDATGTLEQLRCEICNAKVSTLRRGRCWGCYRKWQDLQDVGFGASCVICGERRKDNLQRLELFGKWHNLCHICAVRAFRLNPMPRAVEGIRQRLMRDRRFGDRRYDGSDDRLISKERRVGERRAESIEEDDIIWMTDAPDIILECDEGQEEEVSLTSLFDREEPDGLMSEDSDLECLELDRLNQIT